MRTTAGLQRLLDLCSAYCVDWDICLNSKKTKNMVFGKPTSINFKPSLNGSPIEWVSEWKYLGVVLKSGRSFGCSVVDKVKSFYRSLNSILRVEGRSQDMVLLNLIEAHCVPILAYGIETIVVADRDERRSLRVAYNSIFRKIFGYRHFESVTNLQHSLRRHTWEELVEARQTSFARRASACASESLVRAFCWFSLYSFFFSHYRLWLRFVSLTLSSTADYFLTGLYLSFDWLCLLLIVIAASAIYFLSCYTYVWINVI